MGAWWCKSQFPVIFHKLPTAVEAKRFVLTASLEKQSSAFDSCRFTQKIQGLTLQRFPSYEDSRGERFRVISADFWLTSDGRGGQTAGFNSFFRKAKFGLWFLPIHTKNPGPDTPTVPELRRFSWRVVFTVFNRRHLSLITYMCMLRHFCLCSIKPWSLSLE